jgi:hypothetical protein
MEVLEVLAKELHAVLDRAREVDLGAATDDELDAALVDLGRLRDRVAALEATVAGEWDARKLWARNGARSAGSWLAHQHRVPQAASGRVPRWGRRLRHLPAVAAAWSAGRITDAHVQRITRADTPRVHAQLLADQVEIVRWAMELPWRPFVRRLQDWLDTHDPDGPEPDPRDGRHLSCSRTVDDTWRLDGWLDPVAGTVFARELDRLERLEFLADQRDATERLGRVPLANELARTSVQRRADALVLMAERSATLPDDGRRAQPLFTVLVGHDSLRRILELTNGIELRPGQVAPYLEPALLEQVLFDSKVHPVGVSSQRTYQGLLRKAILVRDRICAHPVCDAPVDDLQVDHKQPAAQGGPTTEENGRGYCAFHNLARNDPDWVEPPDPVGSDDDDPP